MAQISEVCIDERGRKRPAQEPGQRPNGRPQQRPSCANADTALGRPLDIGAVASLIGCSPWTVRQRLIPKGLPYFRAGASGKLIFYESQIIRWIEKQQGRRTTHV